MSKKTKETTGAASPPIGAFVRIEKPALQAIVDRLRGDGYRTVLPHVRDGAVVYDEVESISELPIDLIDEQDGGTYRLKRSGRDGYFDYVVGPHSLKNFLFPPRETVLEGGRVDGRWQFKTPEPAAVRLAVIGVRSCDLHALAVQDRVFLQGRYVDPGYKARRDGLFLVAVNCRRAAATCFCHSMNTGPAATFGFDLALTEMDDCFVVQIGTERGGTVVIATDWQPCSADEVQQGHDVSRRLEEDMKRRKPATADSSSSADEPRGRHLDTSDIRDLLMGNLEHPRWDEVAQRCLACTNCTLVCPTCFCSSVEEVTDLTGEHVRRERSWSSCFTAEHSYMSSGVVRQTTKSRYRQWLTHKLATWIDQFGTSGCIGCGRCITWCPVGIDLTEEVAAIRGDTQ